MRVAADNLELPVAEEEAKEPPLGQVQMLNQHSESVDLSDRLESSQRSEEQKLTLQLQGDPRMVMESSNLSQNQNPHQPEEEQKVELLPRR